MKILVIGAYPASLSNFRGELLRSLSKEHDVFAVASTASLDEVKNIESLGVKYIDLSINRNGLSPLEDIHTFIDFLKLIKNIRPDVILAYTIKPIIWGGLAARISSTNFFGLVTGLGFAFQSGGLKRNLLRSLVIFLYRTSLKKSRGVIFQNPDNLKVFTDSNIVTSDKCFLVNGSGVDLSHFSQKLLPQVPRFLLIARLLREKGIREYLQAAKSVKAQYPNAEFHLVGPADPSPDGIALSEVEGWHDNGVIQYHGATKDVRPFIEACSIFVLPSYHEGMPRTVLEAMATGRPILTTNVPGCKETVVNGVNGWLVEKGNADQLAEKMIWFIENPVEWQRMADESYTIAKEKFDVHKVNAKLLEIMGLDRNNEKII